MDLAPTPPPPNDDGSNHYSSGSSGYVWTECNDNIDNDGDGLIDFDGDGVPELKDPGCTGFFDDNETNPAIIEPEKVVNESAECWIDKTKTCPDGTLITVRSCINGTWFQHTNQSCPETNQNQSLHPTTQKIIEATSNTKIQIGILLIIGVITYTVYTYLYKKKPEEEQDGKE